jgi:transcriptional regulator with GAF, ATPase, and Fis domain
MTAAVARIVARHIPINAVLVEELDIERSCLETVGIGLAGQTAPEARRVNYPPTQMKQLLAWCKRGEIGHRRAQSSRHGEWTSLVPKDFGGDVLAGPLSGQTGPLGVLLLLASASRGFEPRHAHMLGALIEPFAVALENNRRLRELTAETEAAEADKQSLLTRLGRSDLMPTIVGATAGLRAVMERAVLVSRSDVPVLIFGETGAGKEVIARAVHMGSRRVSGPFIRANCGAIPPELVDSQLFGHERGSFTGATDTRKGWFERADGGTLFLDEIGELPLPAQVRLLRILQDGHLERVGAQEHITVDVRIVAATHRDLVAMVREGRFREDLWYRIGVFPILLPPLRERIEDIPALARHFAERAATRFGLPIQLPTPEDIASLIAYPWPGNVRELAAVIDRAAILGNGERLEVTKALGAPALGLAPERVPPPVPPGAPAPARVASIDTAMRQHIEATLAMTHGRVEGPHGAAVLLGINPHTLRARMRKLGIDWGRFRPRA